MNHSLRPLAFVITSTQTGTMIVNRFDQQTNRIGETYGVGYQYLSTSAFDPDEISLALNLLRLRRHYFGDGVIALDCGANIGAHTIPWGIEMTHWGEVLAFEAQERVYYALAGNIAINNLFNVRAMNIALGDDSHQSHLDIPIIDYNQSASFGSLELKPLATPEFIGQDVNYQRTQPVPLLALDKLNLQRLDFIKMDVEGMEQEVLNSGAQLIARFKPILLVEVLKSGIPAVKAILAPLGYQLFAIGLNVLAIHQDDPCLENVNLSEV
ncbi:FkbM family methyltransferase [Pasteurellaceae bacterium Macca]|nr:FkbM family methyltransferase [Pasteurellaceae bacterium Macca]